MSCQKVTLKRVLHQNQPKVIFRQKKSKKYRNGVPNFFLSENDFRLILTVIAFSRSFLAVSVINSAL